MDNRFRQIHPFYASHADSLSESNDAADQIIESPDRFLLNQEEVFNAQGGYQTLALALFGGALGMATVFGSSARMATYFKNGQLKAAEWLCLGGAATIGYTGGNFIGVSAFGESQRLHNHWMAYHFVKTQNRYEGYNVLSKAPTY